MYLGRIVGSVVAQTKYEGLQGAKLLLVQPLDHEQKPSGALEVAVDTARAGPGDLVFLVGSREAALALPESFVPVDATIVGIVDSVNGAAPLPGRTAAAAGEAQGRAGAAGQTPRGAP